VYDNSHRVIVFETFGQVHIYIYIYDYDVQDMQRHSFWKVLLLTFLPCSKFLFAAIL